MNINSISNQTIKYTFNGVSSAEKAKQTAKIFEIKNVETIDKDEMFAPIERMLEYQAKIYKAAVGGDNAVRDALSMYDDLKTEITANFNNEDDRKNELSTLELMYGHAVNQYADDQAFRLKFIGKNKHTLTSGYRQLNRIDEHEVNAIRKDILRMFENGKNYYEQNGNVDELTDSVIEQGTTTINHSDLNKWENTRSVMHAFLIHETLNHSSDKQIQEKGQFIVNDINDSNLSKYMKDLLSGFIQINDNSTDEGSEFISKVANMKEYDDTRDVGNESIIMSKFNNSFNDVIPTRIISLIPENYSGSNITPDLIVKMGETYISNYEGILNASKTEDNREAKIEGLNKAYEAKIDSVIDDIAKPFETFFFRSKGFDEDSFNTQIKEMFESAKEYASSGMDKTNETFEEFLSNKFEDTESLSNLGYKDVMGMSKTFNKLPSLNLFAKKEEKDGIVEEWNTFFDNDIDNESISTYVSEEAKNVSNNIIGKYEELWERVDTLGGYRDEYEHLQERLVELMLKRQNSNKMNRYEMTQKELMRHLNRVNNYDSSMKEVMEKMSKLGERMNALGVIDT